MIILFTRTGQMCNQLISLASVFALGVEYKCTVKCPLMNNELKKFFAFESSEFYNSYMQMNEMQGSTTIIKIIKVIKKVFPRFLSGKYHPEKKHVQIFCDWLSFLDLEIFRKHLTDIRAYFAFKPEVLKVCNEKIKNIKHDDLKIVGVHIRRGDYKEYRNGCWYYSDYEYIHWMKELKKIEKNIVFLIASNEPVDEKIYVENGVDVIQFDNTAVEDVCMLSMCDYIMGPPSTFSMWASILGDTPRCVLEERNYHIKWDDFITMGRRIDLGLEFQ